MNLVFLCLIESVFIIGKLENFWKKSAISSTNDFFSENKYTKSHKYFKQAWKSFSDYDGAKKAYDIKTYVENHKYLKHLQT